PFFDVAKHEWFAPFVSICKNSGIVGGYSDGSFRPANPINRAEMAKIVVGMKEGGVNFQLFLL
ncbi:S-layer homology domain-containing protein, partial [Candidatus Gracilibacteria bacterium]|nr:S-layer homology domain-containing protein [Candidatus Gracilibacteria bacterium]